MADNSELMTWFNNLSADEVRSMVAARRAPVTAEAGEVSDAEVASHAAAEIMGNYQLRHKLDRHQQDELHGDIQKAVLRALAARRVQPKQDAPTTAPVEWRYLVHGKGAWKHCYTQPTADVLLAENAILPKKRRHVIEPLYSEPCQPPKQDAPSPDVAGLIERLRGLAHPLSEAMSDGERLTMLIHAADEAATALSRLTPPKPDDAQDSTVGARELKTFLHERGFLLMERIVDDLTASLASARADGREEAATAADKMPHQLGHVVASAIRALINKDAGAM